MDKMIKVSIIVGILIVSLSAACYFIILLTGRMGNQNNIEKAIVQESDSVYELGKKQSLTDFYNRISAAIDNKDFGKLYELLPQSLRNYITREQYVAYQEKIVKDEKKVISKSTTVNSITVEGNKGIVDRTIVTCFTEMCADSDRIEYTQKKEYEYVSDKWQQSDPQPSERALTASTNAIEEIILKFPKEKRDNFINKESYNTGSVALATRTFALELDKDMQKLILVEHDLKKVGSTINTGNQTLIAPSYSDQTYSDQRSESSLDKYKQEQQQQCQEDLNEYNVCMNEYNAKMGEYNTCLSKNSDPDTTFKSYCFKPSNFCFKPACAY